MYSFTYTTTPDIYTLSLHDALPISCRYVAASRMPWPTASAAAPCLPTSGLWISGLTPADSPRHRVGWAHAGEIRTCAALACLTWILRFRELSATSARDAASNSAGRLSIF